MTSNCGIENGCRLRSTVSPVVASVIVLCAINAVHSLQVNVLFTDRHH